ncbi:MAG: hypothetical protein HKL87_06840 [Acidimicrobiaceae bacterium]|nr:hypothetical protein [Acidimicrobiaceae bacterium]
MSDMPFGPMFDDLMRMLSQQGSDAWFTNATQMAMSIARGDDGDPNAHPELRQRLEQLAPLVSRHLAQRMGQPLTETLEATTRSQLTQSALVQWRPLLEPMVTLTQNLPGLGEVEGFEESAGMMAQFAHTLGPLFLGFQLGSVAGHYSERAFSLAALPLPRTDSATLVVNNIARFAEEWSLDLDQVMTFALVEELVSALVLSQPGVGDALRFILADTVREAARTQGDILSRLQDMSGSADASELLAHPERLLEGLQSPEDSSATRALNAALAALLAVGDVVADEITGALTGPHDTLLEAWRRRRLSDARGEDAAAALFGASLQGDHHERAERWARHILSTHGDEALSALLRADALPSDDELSDPERWWNRVSTSPLA